MKMTGKDTTSNKDLVLKGRKHMEKREFDKAEVCFDLALELDPQYWDAWSAKGDLLFEKEKD